MKDTDKHNYHQERLLPCETRHLHLLLLEMTAVKDRFTNFCFTTNLIVPMTDDW